MGHSITRNTEKDDQTVYGPDKNIHINLECYILEIKASYSAVIRSAMTYGSTIWHTPKDIKKSKTSTSKLSIMQNRCLCTIAGAFKATSIPVLSAETHIAPIDVHLDQLQGKGRYRLRVGGQASFIAKNCKAIANKLRGKSGRKRAQQPTPGMENTTGLEKCWQMPP